MVNMTSVSALWWNKLWGLGKTHLRKQFEPDIYFMENTGELPRSSQMIR